MYNAIMKQFASIILTLVQGKEHKNTFGYAYALMYKHLMLII